MNGLQMTDRQMLLRRMISLGMILALPILTTGCQAGKWKVPSLPKMADWKGGPRLFRKKDKEGIGPPPQYFDEETQIAADDSEVNVDVDVGTPMRPPTSLPSRELNPDKAIVQNNPAQTPTGAVSDSFVMPKVGPSDPAASQAAGIRPPYTYEPKGGDSLINAAAKLENDWDRLRNEAGQQAAGMAKDASDKLGAAVTSARGFAGLSQSGNELQPLATKSTAENDSANSSGFEGINGSAGSSNETSKVSVAPPLPDQPSETPEFNTTPSIDYPKTAQADNRFQNLQNAVRDSMIASNPASAASQNPNGNTAAPSGGGFQPLDRDSRVADYTIERSAPATVGSQRGSVAELPQELLNSSGEYSPGSTGRTQGRIY